MIKNKTGLTLIELLVSIAIAALIVGVTVFMLRSAVDAYGFAQNEALLQQILREAMDEITDGGVAFYGIKDALTIVSASDDTISFVPPFIDGPYDANADGEYELSTPIEPGSSIPIGEVKKEDDKNFYPESVTFVYGKRSQSLEAKDQVAFNDPLPIGSMVHFVYQPDILKNSEALLYIKWDGITKELLRIYRNKTDVIPRHRNPIIKLDEVRFEYYDNTNSQILPEDGRALSKYQLSLITAVKIILTAQIQLKGGKQTERKSLPTFVNIRNTRNAGVGIIIRPETKILIPDSHHIRAFTLANIMGVKEGDMIEFEAKPEEGNGWKIRIFLGINDQGLEIIKKYEVEYPPPNIVFSETINRTVDLGLNFLTLGANGIYDYKYDAASGNFVDLKGKVMLKVNRMDVDGAALYIRP